MSPTTVAITGATRNFFKIGHKTIHVLAQRYPSVNIRLALPDVNIAKSACKGAEVEFVQWDREDPESLIKVYQGCTSVLMVPPIQDRIRVGDMYVSAAKKAGVQFICCIGIQHANPQLMLSREVEILEQTLVDSGIPHCTLNLPMFLENLLYQAPSIKDAGEFYYPCKPDSKISYTTCGDLSEVVARMLACCESFGDTTWTAESQTTAAELADSFSHMLNKDVRFVEITGETFINGLMHDGMSRHAAECVLELWKEINEGHDVQPNDTFARILGRRPETVREWLEDHVCCFTPHQHCDHPQPPLKSAHA